MVHDARCVLQEIEGRSSARYQGNWSGESSAVDIGPKHMPMSGVAMSITSTALPNQDGAHARRP